jgi:predicted ATPase
MVTAPSSNSSDMKNNHLLSEISIIEQPELHLHPAAQAELAELFVSCVSENKNRNLLIETHSEHFIRKLQVLIADSNYKISNEDVAVYYIDKDQDGIATINRLKIMPNGKFEKKWPTGFFDKAYELSMELLKASTN